MEKDIEKSENNENIIVVEEENIKMKEIINEKEN